MKRAHCFRRPVALLALTALCGALLFLGFKYVLVSEVPNQTPPVQRSFNKPAQ